MTLGGGVRLGPDVDGHRRVVARDRVTKQPQIPAKPRTDSPMFRQDRNALRRIYIEAWRKSKTGEPMEPLEQQVAEVVRRHREYHRLLDAGDDALERDWLPEQGATNPFLHMGLHIALLEQITTDRPPGIRARYRQAIAHCLGDVHEAEHRIMDCLAEALWKAQRYGGDLDAKALLACIDQRIDPRGGDRNRPRD